MNSEFEIFARRLKKARNHAQLTQQQFASKLGIPLGAYATYESLTVKTHRNPNFTMLVKIAVLLGTATDYLLGKDTWEKHL